MPRPPRSLLHTPFAPFGRSAPVAVPASSPTCQGHRPPRARRSAAALATGVALALLTACSTPPPTPADPTLDQVAQRLQALWPADVLLLGEQHDADEHQRLQRAVVQSLARQGRLAALALEMAEQGRSTAGLPADASEATVQQALHWAEAGWPWDRYGPVVMAAVHAGVPVLGANLPRSSNRVAMKNEALDAHLTRAAAEKQIQAIRSGHCDLLPDSQWRPMLRVQTARDAAMAQTVLAAHRPGQVVLLVAGGGHVRRDVGVPTHLPPGLQVRVLLARTAGDAPVADGSLAVDGVADMVWDTPALPPQDHCAELRRQLPAARSG